MRKHFVFRFKDKEGLFTVGHLWVKRVMTIRDTKTNKVKEILFYDEDDMVIAHYWICFFEKIVIGWEIPNGEG